MQNIWQNINALFSTSNVCFGSTKFYLTSDVIRVHGNIDGNQDKSGSIKFVSDSTGFPRFFSWDIS